MGSLLKLINALIKTVLGQSENCLCGNFYDDGWDQCNPLCRMRCDKGVK